MAEQKVVGLGQVITTNPSVVTARCSGADRERRRTRKVQKKEGEEEEGHTRREERSG